MTYSFLVICIKLYKLAKGIINKIIENNSFLKMYKDDHKLRYKLSLFSSLILNTIYVIFKLVSGIFYQSLWFISFAIYYFILVIMRINIAEYELSKKLVCMMNI